ncbi:MAG: addiction module toxin, HicA family [Anaerolineae bacterium]|nr:addiction module toxin, HicA family [Anaerolineae bacterium]
MPRLPVVSGSQVVHALERLGFEQTRQRGSHVVMRRATCGRKRVCVVPLHQEVQVGTLAGILRQADVTADEFIANL